MLHQTDAQFRSCGIACLMCCSDQFADLRCFCGSQLPCDRRTRIIGLGNVEQKQQCILAGRFVEYSDAVFSGSDIPSAVIPLCCTGDVLNVGVLPIHQCCVGKGQFV